MTSETKQRAFIAIGYWTTESKVVCAEPEKLPSPQSLVSTAWQYRRYMDSICKYLDNGRTLVAWRGLSYCRMCGRSDEVMGSDCLTDGVWAWPQGLSHYLRAHDIMLPEKFVEHAIKNDWVVGEYCAIATANKRALYDFDYWIEWSGSCYGPN